MRANQQSTRGSVLVITLYILLTMGAILGVLTAIIINQLHSVTNYSRSYIARAGGETAVERALYYAQLARVTKTLGVEETVTLLDTLSGTLDNDTTYSVDAAVDNDLIITKLPVDGTVQYDVFDEDYSTGSLQLTGLTDLNLLSFDWDYDTSCTNTPQLEISAYRWEPIAWADLSDPTSFTTHYIVNCIPPATSGITCQYALGGSSTYLYRVRVKALNCSAIVGFAAHDTTGAHINLHSQLDIDGIALFVNATQRIKAQAMWHPPINDYLDYVIFSDETLTK